MPIASSMLIEPQDVNCQLFIQEQDALMNIGLPIQLPDDFYAKQNAIPKIVDCNTGKRYQLMELSGETGNYNFNLGEEVRVRVRNTSSKALHFTLMYQDQQNRYHSLFPHFAMNIRSIPTSFKTLYPGQESVVSIPSDKLPHMNEFLTQASSSMSNNSGYNISSTTPAASFAAYAAAAAASAAATLAADAQKGNAKMNGSGYYGDASYPSAAASAVAANANASQGAAAVETKRNVANNNYYNFQMATSSALESLANIRLVLIVTACQTFNEVLNELKHISGNNSNAAGNNGSGMNRQEDEEMIDSSTSAVVSSGRRREDKKLLLFNYKFDVKYRPVLV